MTLPPVAWYRPRMRATLPPPETKQAEVQRMFTAIARRYDLNNTLLSLGLHHRWKRRAVALAHPRAGERALDLCAGTADLAIRLAAGVAPGGRVAAVDLNEAMLRIGRQKAMGGAGKIFFAHGNAERIPFRDGSFSIVTVGFGIRNVADIPAALREIRRVLSPGGRFVCLEFSRPPHPFLRAAYDLYSFRLLPFVGAFTSGDRTGVYRYLPTSIRAFPDQEGFAAMLRAAGFRAVTYRNLSGGIVAVHLAWR